MDYTRFYHSYAENGFPHFHDTWSQTRFKRWLEKLDAIEFEQWEDKYWHQACDGEQWELHYKYEGENTRCISGSNAYPENWEQFKKLIMRIARKLPRVEIMSLDEFAKLFIDD